MPGQTKRFHFLFLIPACLAIAYVVVLWCANTSVSEFLSLSHLPLIGLLGAIIANSSGTGGGVVFLPVFNTLNESGHLTLSQTNILAASFLIQCFGMTMGAFIWCRKLYSPENNSHSISISSFWKTAAAILALALPTMLATQYFTRFNPSWIFFSFKIFSIFLGLTVIATTLKNRSTTDADLKHAVSDQDFKVLLFLAPIGGFANALFSVGLGEIIALYLFARGYNIITSSGLAVLISCVSVILGAPYHIINENVPWTIIAFTAPGALLGGYMARQIALNLGAFKLKILAGGWIMVSGILLLLFKLT